MTHQRMRSAQGVALAIVISPLMEKNPNKTGGADALVVLSMSRLISTRLNTRTRAGSGAGAGVGRAIRGGGLRTMGTLYDREPSKFDDHTDDRAVAGSTAKPTSS